MYELMMENIHTIDIYGHVVYTVCLQYMGSTPIILTGNASAKTARMQQAQQVVKLFKVSWSFI